MMRFTFVVVDDDAQVDMGYPRFINSFLCKYNYLEFDGICKIDDSRWNQDGELAMNYEVLSDLTPPKGCSFSKALNLFKQNISRYDFFAIDLDFSKIKSKMNPNVGSDNFNICDEAKLYRENKKDVTLAGLSFIDLTPIDDRPKFIFSGSDRTQMFRDNSRYWGKRLSDVFIINADPNGIFSPDYIEKAVNGLDNYLRKSQIKIIDRQSPETRMRIKAYVKNETWNEPFIPNDGKNMDPSNCWSLKTLFPKQVTSILQKNDNFEMCENYIEQIIETDWRKLMSAGLLKHPHDGNSKIKEKYGDLEALIMLAKFLDFDTNAHKTGSYKKLTELPSFSYVKITDATDKNSLGYLRHHFTEKNEDPRFHIEFLGGNDGLTKSIPQYFSDLRNEQIVNWPDMLDKMCINYGIYPVDIAYISHIVHYNKHYAGGIDPLFKIVEQKDINLLTITWTYNNQKPTKENIEKIKSKLTEATETPFNLSDEGFCDIWKIACWRYHGVLTFGANNLAIETDRSGLITDKKLDTQSTILQIAISRPSYD